MAIYHLHARFVQRSKGRSAVAGAAYRAGEDITDERKNERFNFTHKADRTIHKEIVTPDFVTEPESRGAFWNGVETFLTRKNAQTAFEVEVALPRELTPEQRVELARKFVQEQFVKEGLVVDLCIHNGRASDGGEHPHAHMLMTTRRFGPDGQMEESPATDLQDNPALVKRFQKLEKDGKIDEALELIKGTNLARWREAWADTANDALFDAGHAVKIDHRTLEAQAIEREAMPYVGPAFYQQTRDRLKGWLAERFEKFQELRQFKQIREQFDRIQDTRRDLTAEFLAMARGYADELNLEPEKERQNPRSIEHDR